MASNKSDTSFVWLDVETGGPDYYKYPVIQAAFVATGPMPQFKVIEALEVKLTFDPSVCDQEALEVNSYSPGVWAEEAVTPEAAVKVINDFLDRHCSVPKKSRKGNLYFLARGAGHNIARFDIPAIHKLFKDNGGGFCPLAYLGLDTLGFITAMYWLMGRDLESFSMDALAEEFGIEAGGHDALSDVYANIELMRVFLANGFPETWE